MTRSIFPSLLHTYKVFYSTLYHAKFSFYCGVLHPKELPFSVIKASFSPFFIALPKRFLSHNVSQGSLNLCDMIHSPKHFPLAMLLLYHIHQNISPSWHFSFITSKIFLSEWHITSSYYFPCEKKYFFPSLLCHNIFFCEMYHPEILYFFIIKDIFLPLLSHHNIFFCATYCTRKLSICTIKGILLLSIILILFFFTLFLVIFFAYSFYCTLTNIFFLW